MIAHNRAIKFCCNTLERQTIGLPFSWCFSETKPPVLPGVGRNALAYIFPKERIFQRIILFCVILACYGLERSNLFTGCRACDAIILFRTPWGVKLVIAPSRGWTYHHFSGGHDLSLLFVGACPLLDKTGGYAIIKPRDAVTAVRPTKLTNRN